jgi:membrane protease YdiL (CAAX protease family)
MNEVIPKPPLIRQGWLRVLLFCIAYFLLTILMYIPVSMLVKFLNRDAIKQGAKIGEELMSWEFLWISVLIALVVSLLAVFLFRKFIDRKDVLSLGFRIPNQADAWTGFFLAPAILGIGTLILYFARHLQWTDITFNGTSLFLEFGMMLFVAFYEEAVFRGYILGNLMESFNKWIALLISALLFTLFHLVNPGIGFIPMLNIFLAGILLGINYIYTKNLWFAILFHLAWNFFQGPVLGYKVSGVNLATLLQTEVNGDLLLTGGDFGFEGSVFDLALTIIAIILLYQVYEKKYTSVLQAA